MVYFCAFLLKVKTSQHSAAANYDGLDTKSMQRQSNVRSKTEAVTGEAVSSQDLNSTRFAVSAINSTYSYMYCTSYATACSSANILNIVRR